MLKSGRGPPMWPSCPYDSRQPSGSADDLLRVTRPVVVNGGGLLAAVLDVRRGGSESAPCRALAALPARLPRQREECRRGGGGGPERRRDARRGALAWCDRLEARPNVYSEYSLAADSTSWLGRWGRGSWPRCGRPPPRTRTTTSEERGEAAYAGRCAAREKHALVPRQPPSPSRVSGNSQAYAVRLKSMTSTGRASICGAFAPEPRGGGEPS